MTAQARPVDSVAFAKAMADDTRQEIMKHLCCEWLSVNERRLQMRAKFERFFAEVDVLLLPVMATTAFAHDHSEPQFARSVLVDDVQRPQVVAEFNTVDQGAAQLLVGHY